MVDGQRPAIEQVPEVGAAPGLDIGKCVGCPVVLRQLKAGGAEEFGFRAQATISRSAAAADALARPDECWAASSTLPFAAR